MKTITNQSAKELIIWLEDYKLKLSGREMKVLNEKRRINNVIKKLKK
ncbi:MAG: hypothetical protein RR705_08500 [Lachnospiraceae bacterium]